MDFYFSISMFQVISVVVVVVVVVVVLLEDRIIHFRP